MNMRKLGMNNGSIPLELVFLFLLLDGLEMYFDYKIKMTETENKNKEW